MEISRIKEKIYAGFLGMCAGIRLGAPVEPGIWTEKRIRETYGDVRGYLREYKNFAADDDSNGPVYFLRALLDDARERDPQPQDVGRAWLNYARNGVGLYWWGGYGISTEHTAYINLLSGIPAPASGSAAVNGKVLSEQIGGQIFIDTWGLICPGDPAKAADLGELAASVSHDGEGLNGARFFCAAIAEAFETSDIGRILNTALSLIPTESLYYRVADAVIGFHRENPEDFRACFRMLERDWGYDKYTGVCHIIPNAGVCILAMLYGNGRFDRTIEIATMCGWDTDCNAGNVGTVLGVAVGLEGIPDHYRRPINDSIVLSGIAGSLNILDIPSYTDELCALARRFTGLPLEGSLRENDNLSFGFELPGSTHGMRLSNNYQFRLRHSTEAAHCGSGSLEVLFDRLERGQRTKVFYKPFYTRDAFSDERYMPVFSPQVCAGQTLSVWVRLDQWAGNEEPGIAPYLRLAHSKEEWVQGFVKPVQDQWMEITWILPDTRGAVIDEIGLVIEGSTPAKFRSTGRLFIDDFTVSGKADYTIDFTKQRREFASVTPFSHNGGTWTLGQDGMCLFAPESAQAFTGRYHCRDVRVTAELLPQYGESHLLCARCQGAMRGYWAGLSGAGRVAIYKNDFGMEALAEAEVAWAHNRPVTLTMQVEGEEITLLVNGEPAFAARDTAFAYGMVGCGTLAMGRAAYRSFAVTEL